VEVAAFQDRSPAGLDIVTVAAVRLEGGAVASLSLSGVAPARSFELVLVGESGTLRVDDEALVHEPPGRPAERVALPPRGPDVDADFVAAIREARPPACPADDALATVKLLEAIARSAASGAVTRVA
jgi:predicted dehydrogenase